jgi:C2 domain
LLVCPPQQILSCHNLPNVDVGEAVGNFTDAFVCAVFEDAMVQTPVIYDELSPHWMPWTDRAFCFGILHPASMLHLGVFDYDLGPMLPHEPLGRAMVNVAHFQRDTDYTLRYNLYKSADITDRSPMGSITVRLRVTYHDEKRALLAALGPRPKFHINVRRDKSHSVVRYTCFGEYNRDNKFEMTLARSYINEILEYKRALSYCVVDSAVSILFWQGQVRVAGFYLPLHSFLLFAWGTVLLERPQLFPSFLLLSVAWILLATQTRRQQHPSPWRRCPSFWHYAKILYFGSSPIETKSIGVNEGASEAQAYEQQWQERLDKDARVADARCAFQEQMTAFDESIHTKTESGWDPDLLVRLARYQRYLATVCQYFRLIKLVVTWEESILAFWITACFLVGGILSLLLPWSFVLFWTGRLFVYGLLGPHMKIVGMVILGHSQHEKDDEAKIQRILETFRKQSLGARLRHQEAVKLKDVLRLSFGPFSTLTPALNLSRHYDYPLSVSHAQARSSGKTDPKMAVQQPHIPGQYCRGIMVPRCGVAAEQSREEMPHLERLRESLQECIQCIHDQENSELVRRLRSIGSNEGDIPEAVGYELISLLGLNGPNSCHKSDTSIVVGESSSLHLNATLDVAVMAVRRRNGPRNSIWTSQRIEVVPLEQNAEQESQLKLGPTSTLLHSNDPRLAILETSEHRLSLRRSLCYNHVRLPKCELPINDEQLHTGGVEVIWEDSDEESDKSTVHNSETRNHVPGLLHTIIPMEPELVYQREDDNFVQYYKLFTPSRIDAGPMHHEEHLE